MCRSSISLKTKLKIIKDINNDVSYEVIKNRYGLKSSANITTIWARRDAYLDNFNNKNLNLSIKTIKKTKYQDIDKGLLNFIANCNNKGVPVNDICLQVQALKIAKDAKHNDFKASNGYLEKFKKRNKVVFATIHGEAGSVDSSVIENWINLKLTDII